MMVGNATDYIQTVALVLPAVEAQHQQLPMTTAKKHSNFTGISACMRQIEDGHTIIRHSHT